MIRESCLLILLFLVLIGCLRTREAASDPTISFRLDTLTLVDKIRSRQIPVAIYKPTVQNSKIIIFSHGYGQNRAGSYLTYSYLTAYLACKGYFVVSIQHELPTDSLMPSAGVPQIVRRSSWERGADNILAVINKLKMSDPALDFKHITLIGHSNGADMSALFPLKYPNIVDKIITLDNRRMPLPKTTQPKIYSLRSSDQPADEGVLPTKTEIKKYRMTIIKLPNTAHNDMDDRANAEQRDEIRSYIMGFLKSQ